MNENEKEKPEMAVAAFYAHDEVEAKRFAHCKDIFHAVWEYLEEMRLQNTQLLNKKILTDFAQKFKTPKLDRAAKIILNLIQE